MGKMLGCLLLCAACGGAGEDGPGRVGGSGARGPASGSGGGGDQAGGGDGAGTEPSFSNADGSVSDTGPLPNAQFCSADLQTIVDGDGKEIERCPQDKGCHEGKCIDACEAADRSKGSLGCVFLAPEPPFAGQQWTTPAPELAGACYAAFIANGWDGPTKLIARRDGAELDVTDFGRIPRGVVPSVTYDPIPAKGLPPGEVAILFLSQSPTTQFACPVAPALNMDAAVNSSGRGRAFEIESDRPVTAYAILPYGGASSFLPSATLLLPVSALGDNYLTIGPHVPPDPDPSSGWPGLGWVLMVGSVDGTSVRVAPPVTLPGGTGVDPAPAGVTTTYSLGRGEIVQWFGPDASGTIFESDQPIALFTGNTYLHVPSATATSGGHDAAHQQIPPVSALGDTYVAPAMQTRLQGGVPESVPYRLLGAIDGTELSYDPAAPAGAPTLLDAGESFQFESTGFFTVRSQGDTHPFLFTQYMTGSVFVSTSPGTSCTTLGTLAGTCGDEEWVNLLPPKQFLRRYVFFTDPTYSTTSLTITRVRGDDGFAAVTLECLGKVSGFEPVGADGDYEVAHVDLLRAGVPTKDCDGSLHVAQSSERFGITVWGLDTRASYAYPAGGNVVSINDVEIPTPD